VFVKILIDFTNLFVTM